jgi:hypothetical protein
MLAVGSYSGIVVLWDLERGEPVHFLKLHKGPAKSVAFTPDGARLATRGADRRLVLWDVRNGQDLLQLESSASLFRKVVFSPDGRRLAADLHQGIRVWEAPPSGEIRILRGHRAPVELAQFSPDGEWIVTVSVDREVKVWEADTGRLRWTFESPREQDSFSFSRDGHSLLAGVNLDLGRAWDLRTGQQLTTIDEKAYNDDVRSSINEKQHKLQIEGTLVRIIDVGPPSELELERRLLHTAPDYPWHSRMAQAAERLKRPGMGPYHLGRLVQATPWDASLWLRHGSACARDQQLDRAALSFVQAILADPHVGRSR